MAERDQSKNRVVKVSGSKVAKLAAVALTVNARKAMPYPVPVAEPFQTLRTIGSANRGPNLS